MVRAGVQVNASGFQSNTFQTIKNTVTYNVIIFTNSTTSNFKRDSQTSDSIRFNRVR